MGNEITGNNGKVNGNATEQTTGGSGNGTGSTSTSSPNTRTDNGGTGGSGTGTGTGTTNTKEKELPKLVTVTPETDEAEQKRLERNRKRRERYEREKLESGQTVKPRKVNKTKKAETPATTMSKEQLNNLLVSTSAVIATRPNCSHWLLTEKEADSITTPLLAIIAESEKLEIITKNSNQIALVIACITIFAPRLFITVQQNKATKQLVKKEIKTNGHLQGRTEQTRTTENSNKKPNIENDGGVATSTVNNDYVLSWDD